MTTFLNRVLSWLGWGTPARSKAPDAAWRQLEFAIDYTIRDVELFRQAFKHRSYLSVSNESRVESYERLEFLGDAVLSLVTATRLYEKFPNEDEGELTKNKSCLVNKHILAERARRLRLGDYLYLSDGEDRSGGRDRSSILSDILESLIGAIYLDGGFSAACRFVDRHVLFDVEQQLSDHATVNHKGELLELAQSMNWGLPHYAVTEEVGPEHSKLFTVQVSVRDATYGIGKGSTKKSAEQMAAMEALRKLKQDGMLT